MAKTNEISGLSDKEILAKVSALKFELFNLKFNRFTSGIEKSHLLQKTKKDIARLLTVKNSKK